MLELVWSQLALSDLFAIIDYISDDNPDAAQNLKDNISEKTLNLIQFPNMGKLGRVSGTRELVTGANYVVVYQVTESHVHILRVLHAAQQWPPSH